ncbi:MAG: hypothetical protein KF749_03130 [Bacteroidetes bacterium]|nr:hypothetical protein [Bacteroidota bacterium]MCW5896810.1 hypothetical protein [Bacteroidota bacterium]
MKRLECAVLVCAVMLWGCTHTRPLDVPHPELVRISSLPSFSSFIYKDKLTLSVLFRVVEDGTIAEVKMLGSSGDPRWDAVAIDSMKHWRFHPLAGECPPDGIWVRNALVVQVEEQVVMALAGLTAPDERGADSLYALLEQGVPFEALARDEGETPGFSAPASRNIAQFPRKVRDEVRKLRVGNFTKPIRVGERYVIYQRFEQNSGQSIVQ